MMKNRYLGVIICFSILALACSSSDDGGGDPDPNPPVTIDPPEAAALVFPEQDSECTEGSNFTPTQSDVPFDWNDAANTTSYELVLKNLDTQTTTEHTSSTSQITLTIERGTPYSWYVISRNDGNTTAQSSTWKFYNAGESVTSYAPFPAELVGPAMGSTLPSTATSALLRWTGSDVDDDIENYDVLFGTVNPPTVVVASDVTDSEYSVNVASGNTYYWQIITNDSEGNNSASEVFQFRVD